MKAPTLLFAVALIATAAIFAWEWVGDSSTADRSFASLGAEVDPNNKSKTAPARPVRGPENLEHLGNSRRPVSEEVVREQPHAEKPNDDVSKENRAVEVPDPGGMTDTMCRKALIRVHEQHQARMLQAAGDPGPGADFVARSEGFLVLRSAAMILRSQGRAQYALDSPAGFSLKSTNEQFVFTVDMAKYSVARGEFGVLDSIIDSGVLTGEVDLLQENASVDSLAVETLFEQALAVLL